MRVDQTGVTGLPEVAANDGKPAGRPTRRTAPNAVVVSEGVRAHHEQQRAVEAQRAEQIRSIAARVQSGNYHVDFQKLAERMVDDQAAGGGRGR